MVNPSRQAPLRITLCLWSQVFCYFPAICRGGDRVGVAMTVFPNAITFREWVTYLLRGKRHYDSAELENLSDRSLEDIGLEVRKRDFGTLKPFWIP